MENEEDDTEGSNGVGKSRYIPIRQFLNRITKVNYTSLQEYVDLYGNPSKAIINGINMNVLPIAHPRQIGALGAHSEKWFQCHWEWENRKK